LIGGGVAIRGAVGKHRWRWALASALLVAVGIMGSVVGATVLSNNNSRQSHQSLATTSQAIASTLSLVIQQENYLVISTKAFVSTNPNATNTDFLNWISQMQVKEDYPEVRLLGFVATVRPAELPAFIARTQADPPEPLAPGQTTYQVTPAGARPFYCLTEFDFSNGGLSIPLGFDVCAGLGDKFPKALMGSTYLPYTSNKVTYLAVEAPLYPGGVVPTTAQARIDAFRGLVGLTISPSFVLHRALVGHPGSAVMLRYSSGTSKIDFRQGSAPAGAGSTTVDLHNGWSVDIFGAVSGSGILSNSGALVLLLTGTLVSLLLGLLLYTMGTSRFRAIHLVEERTQELHHLALHDPLTGLPNRALILDRIELMLARSRREHTQAAVFFLDLDYFKDVNDTLGHSTGDELLKAVAARLVGAIRQEDTVGRLGGDEFVILAEGASLAAGAEVVAARILDVLSTPFQVAGSGHPLVVTASIGIAEGGWATPGELLQNADIALYQAKEAGRNRSVVFASSMQETVDDHRNLEVDLLTALGDGQFFLLYQPIVDLSSGAFTGVEALLRWQHPKRGVIQPDDFIPVLESNGLIIPVGRWVLEEACRQGAEWQRKGHIIAVSINISANQLGRDGIVDDVRRALDLSSFDPNMCVLELTETTLMHNVAETVGRLTQLKELGVRLAIDDFGTGYSSLAYLQQFPIDVLKIDRTFVSGIGDTAEAAALVHAMVQLGIALQLEVVAEGIEHDAQRTHLIAEKVETGQGFLFARPLDVEAVDRLLEEAEGAPGSSPMGTEPSV
jgi:diguanylate cyclase (GGDEF)-like protein